MEYKTLDPKLNETLCKAYSGGIPEFIQVGKEKWMYPATFRETAQSYKDFITRPDDVWIIGYPRSGTTLTETICWLLTHNFDFDRIKSLPPRARVPFFEFNTVITKQQVAYLKKMSDNPDAIQKSWQDTTAQLDFIKNMTERRVIKSHMPYCLCPKNLFSSGCKNIYIARNVKDVFVSYYHLQKTIDGRAFAGTIEEYFALFEQDLLFFNPYWAHIKQAWELRNTKNFLFLFYEDIRKDLRESIRKIASFLEIKITENQLESLANFMQFDNFKSIVNSSNNQFQIQTEARKIKPREFVRAGKVGGWTEHLSEEVNARMDKWIKKNVTKIGLDGSYPLTR